jgi:DNA mismatch repair ATPase MutS
VEETADGPAMVFDYKVRPGIATSTNALRLMDVVGFEFGDKPAAHLSLKRTFGDR